MPIYPSSSVAIDNNTIKKNSSGAIYVNTVEPVDGSSGVSLVSASPIKIEIKPYLNVGVVHFVPLRVYNSTSTDMTAGSRVYFDINNSKFTSYLNTNSENVNFTDVDGNILTTYCESGWTNTSSACRYYWKLPTGTTIPANGSVIIYMALSSTSSVVLNTTTTGHMANSPAGTYGQYDNGAQVFDFYDNFMGTTLDTTKWASALTSGSGTLVVNNGATLSTSDHTVANAVNLYTKNTLTTELFEIVITVGTFTPSTTGCVGFGYATSAPSTTSSDATSLVTNGYITRWNSASGGYELDKVVSGTNTLIVATNGIAAASGIFGFSWVGTQLKTYYNYVQSDSVVNGSLTNSASYISIYSSGTGGTYTPVIPPAIVRSREPRVTMPTISYYPMDFYGVWIDQYTTSVNPPNPTGTTSTTPVMMGLGSSVTITPESTGNIFIDMVADVANSVANDGATMKLVYGTGTAPSNGAAATGTAVGISKTRTSLAAGATNEFTIIGANITGLVVGTTYWIDIQMNAVTGGTATLSDLQFGITEVSRYV